MFPVLPKSINLNALLVAVWILTALVCTSSLPYVQGPTTWDTIHSIVLVLNYSFMYLIPTFLACLLLKPWFIPRLMVIILFSAMTIIFLFADGRLYDLYGFHFNGFVWNLLTTPGGLESLGADQTNLLMLVKYLLILIAIIFASLLTGYFLRNHSIKWRWIFLTFLVITLSERFIYGVAYSRVYGPIMTQSDHMILYQQMKMNTFLQSLGYEVKKRDKVIKIDGVVPGNINYPLNDLQVDKVEKPYNLLFLVAESLRSKDLINDRVMPETMHFAKTQGTLFTHHYSGGNGTRQGLFPMFYGVYGNYWDLFLRARQTPALFDVLDRYNYDYFIYTGARFTYPEFDQTIFGSIPSEKLIETSHGEPWKRDEKNIDMLLADIDKRDRNTPFMGFVFFESTHARYSFPKDQALEENYLESIDYAGLSREEIGPMINGMKARYINAAHYLDKQLKRVYDYLIKNQLLENTVVIVTGDHGEEFMEKARWGHNSSFIDEQIRVPMVVSFPGKKLPEVSNMTSHMDITATILPTLGVTNPTNDYTLGKNLFSESPQDMVVVASWTDLGIISKKGKLIIPLQGITQHQHLATTKDDEPTDLRELSQKLSEEIASVIANSRKYISRQE